MKAKKTFGVLIFISCGVCITFYRRGLSFEQKKDISDVYMYVRHLLSRTRFEVLSVPDPLVTVDIIPSSDVFGKKFLPQRECIHLSAVTCGDRTEETLVMLKSALLLTRRCLVIHIFAEYNLRQDIRDEVIKWTKTSVYAASLYIYNITYPEQENVDEWKQMFRSCTTQRLFIPDLLTEVDSILYVDTDTLFLNSPETIWKYLSSFNSTQIAGLVTEHEIPSQGWYNKYANQPFYGDLGLNAGVMLMNLTRMRSFKWSNRIIPFYRQYKQKISFADQDLINVLFYFYPDRVFEIPCGWNYRLDHCWLGNNCHDIETNGISLLHGNRGTFHGKGPFGSVYETFRNYELGTSISEELIKPIEEELSKRSYKDRPCTMAMRDSILPTLGAFL
ncbi:Glucoside xylosyltransferase 2 [Holothuria leucospilota]|uniref:UDP-D-xylose:beta-D-glucoside alpha-1,3-D-xylosyltransferase n=1 Tax=Holothuria leucospilota TaxID=206669 RepID=A0A9Q1CSR4_HOLLE|nr:Glucoside xylosyltransferase 2 [Holothuria leucospilota]